MPSAYVVIYTKKGQVMVVKKNKVCAWFNHNGISTAPLPTAIVNNPGQHVFPGGHVNSSQGSNSTPINEKLGSAALREFREETGVNLDPLKPERHVKRYFTCDKHEKQKVLSCVKEEPYEYDFGVVYARYDEKTFETIKQNIATNLNLNRPLHNVVEKYYNICNKPGLTPKQIQDEVKENWNFQKESSKGSAHTVDDELESVESMDFTTARSTFEQENSPQYGKGTTWFIAALDNLPREKEEKVEEKSSSSSTSVSEIRRRRSTPLAQHLLADSRQKEGSDLPEKGEWSCPCPRTCTIL